MSVPCCHKDLHQQFARSGSSGSGSGSSGSGAAASAFSLPGVGNALEPAQAAAQGEDADGIWVEVEGGDERGDDGDDVAAAGGVRALFAPLLRHGILRQRWLDLLTDSLRAQLLRVVGYRWVGLVMVSRGCGGWRVFPPPCLLQLCLCFSQRSAPYTKPPLTPTRPTNKNAHQTKPNPIDPTHYQAGWTCVSLSAASTPLATCSSGPPG